MIMGDSDDSYDFSDLGLFVEKLREGYQLVMGNRFQGGFGPGRCHPCTAILVTRSDDAGAPLLLQLV